MTLRLRGDLAALPAYKPGKSPTMGIGPQFKLSSNENPFSPLPSVAERIADQIGSINRYPDSSASGLRQAISKKFAVSEDQIALGSGSVEVISQLIRATSGDGDEVVFPWRSFEAYPQLTIAAGARPVPVALTSDFRHDLPAMQAAVTPRTRLIIVCTPNNPTGTSLRAGELDELIHSVPSDIIVLVDEAYYQFNRDREQLRGVDFFGRYPNVVVAHTFSKAYGLAGLRVGYALAPADVTSAMRKVSVPFGVTDLAQSAAVASLEAEGELADRVERLVVERERIAAELEKMGWVVPTSEANFFWFPLGDRTNSAVECFARHGILVRPYSGEGLRVSVGDEDANEALLAAARELADSPASTLGR